MSREPSLLTLDTILPGIRVRDLAPAHVSHLRDIEEEQHALMTAWGHPRKTRAMYLSTNGPTSRVLTVRVPPAVTDMGIGLWMAGTGTVTITSAVDATGTELRSANDAGTALTDPELGDYFEAATLLPATYGAASGRAVTVASSVSWASADVDLTFTIADVTSSLTLFLVELIPIHVAR